MRIPSSLTSLVEEGLIDEVVRPLMSGKEAEVFLVYAGGFLRVAKVYKEAENRTFKNRAAYTEGRKTRNSRDQRAIQKRTTHGRAQDESSWRSTEVQILHRLRDAGVRVPAPYNFIDGVLLMEMVADASGHPAPRLAEVRFDRVQAIRVFEHLLGEVVRMLCTGVIHGDLSNFNVLMSADGPVIIDFPQSVDAATNQNARKLLLRDVENLKRFLRTFAPDQRPGPYAEEMWDLYARSLLTPETRLTGRHRPSERRANTAEVLDLIGDANYDERKRRERHGVGMRGLPLGQPQARGAHGGGHSSVPATQNTRQPQGQRPQGPPHRTGPKPPSQTHAGYTPVHPRHPGEQSPGSLQATHAPPRSEAYRQHEGQRSPSAAPSQETSGSAFPRRPVVITIDNRRRRPNSR